jgi:molybdopterin-containing oxidoreductase family membrane subunit
VDPEHVSKTAVADPDPIIEPGFTLAAVTDKISTIVLTPGVTKGWLARFGVAVALFLLLTLVITYLFAFGVGIWGINIPVAWPMPSQTLSGGLESGTREH